MCEREERGLCKEETIGSADNGVGGVDGRWVISCGDGRERELRGYVMWERAEMRKMFYA